MKPKPTSESQLREEVLLILSTTPDDQMYADVLDLLLAYFESSFGYFGYINENGDLVCPSMTRAIFDQCEIPDKSTVFPREMWGGLWGRILKEKVTLIENTVHHVPYGHLSIERSMGSPIVQRGELIGQIHVANRASDYTEEDAHILENITQLIAPVLSARLERDRQETQRRFTEVQLRENEAKLRLLIETADMGIVTIDSTGIIETFNKAAEKIFGYTAAAVIGQPVALLMPPDDASQHNNYLANYLRTGQAKIINLGRELLGRRKDGTLFPMELRVGHARVGDQSFFTGIIYDISERKRIEEQVKISLAEKEVLLKEIHHRVKNNLQIISSLLDLQIDYIHDEKTREVFVISRSRIKSMALIHEQLYQSQDLARVNFAEYVESLTTHLRESYGHSASRIRIRHQLAPVVLALETAIPCGLIINELVSNALKYAFPDGRSGEIWVGLQRIGDEQLSLQVKDNGVGLSATVDLHQPQSLGMSLVQTLTKQIQGDLQFHTEQGMGITITFSVPNMKLSNQHSTLDVRKASGHD